MILDSARPDRRAPLRVAALLVVAALLTLTVGCAAGPSAPPASPTANPPSAGGPTPPPPIPSPGAAPLSAGDVGAWLDGLVPAALARAGIAGAAVTVVHDGQVLAARGYGWADSGSDGTPARPVDPDRTLFRVGSVSKVATATAVMQLVEQGRIDLDTDVARYLDFPLPRRFDAPLTMRHLLTHTAGFEERVRGLIGSGSPAPRLRDVVATDPPEQVFAPGTVPAYSNYGYALAGYIVERVSGTPFDEYMARDVLGRAGMGSSSFAQPLPPALRDRLSAGYPTASDPAQPFEVVGPAPAGALSASATDMARFMLAQLGGPSPGGPLLAPGTAELMRRPALDASSLGALADGPRMGLGLFDESRNSHRIAGHGGDTAYFHAHLQMYPDDATGVFVALNSSGRDAADSLELRESLMAGFADRYFPPAPPASPPVPGTGPSEPAAAISTAHAAMAQGRYESARSPFSTFLSTAALSGQTTVTARGDGTVLVTPAPNTLHPAVYREIRPWVWQEVGGQRILTMRPEGDRVTALGADSAFSLLRVGAAHDAAIVVPVLGACAAVLLVAVLAWPLGAVTRRRLGAPAPVSLGRAGDTARLLGRIAALAGVLALAGWATVATTVLGLHDVPDAVLRALQAVQALALLGVVPAGVLLAVTVTRGARRGGSLPRALGALLLLLALLGTGAFAVVYGLLAPTVSY